MEEVGVDDILFGTANRSLSFRLAILLVEWRMSN